MQLCIVRPEVAMNAITVRNLPPAVARAVKEKARKERLSLNKAIVRLLEEATGGEASSRQQRHHDLDKFFGTWTTREADAFDEALEAGRQIDPEMWK
jgi:hypothetical protein